MRTLMMLAVVTALATGPAMAQTTTTTTVKAPGQPKMTVTKKGPPPASQRTEISKGCSATADSKGLHLKDREKFMRACKKGGKSA